MENLEPLENFRQIYLKKLLKSIVNLLKKEIFLEYNFP